MNNDELMGLGDILIYQTEKGDTRIDVFFQNGDIWMNQSAIARLYNTTPQNITMHIRNIYADGELDELSFGHMMNIKTIILNNCVYINTFIILKSNL